MHMVLVQLEHFPVLCTLVHWAQELGSYLPGAMESSHIPRWPQPLPITKTKTQQVPLPWRVQSSSPGVGTEQNSMGSAELPPKRSGYCAFNVNLNTRPGPVPATVLQGQQLILTLAACWVVACQSCQRCDALGSRFTDAANHRPQWTQPVHGELATGVPLSRDVEPGEGARRW